MKKEKLKVFGLFGRRKLNFTHQSTLTVTSFALVFLTDSCFRPHSWAEVVYTAEYGSKNMNMTLSSITTQTDEPLGRVANPLKKEDLLFIHSLFYFPQVLLEEQ